MQFDPLSPFIAEDGLEYQSGAHYLASWPSRCGRNGGLHALREFSGLSREALARITVRHVLRFDREGQDCLPPGADPDEACWRHDDRVQFVGEFAEAAEEIGLGG